MSAWQLGGPGLHRPLDKLLGTWSGVFPSPLLADIHGRVAALRAAHAPQLLQPAPVPMNGIGSAPGFGYGALAPVQALGPPPMAADPRLALQSAAAYSHHAAPHPPGYQQPPSQYQQASAAAPMHAAQPAASRVDVNGLLASLVDSGLLAAPGAQHSAAAAGFEPPPHQGSGLLATPQYVVATTPPHAPAARATPEREQPASTHFTPDRLKVQACSHYLLHEEPPSTICVAPVPWPTLYHPSPACTLRGESHARGGQSVGSLSGPATAPAHCKQRLRAHCKLRHGMSLAAAACRS